MKIMILMLIFLLTIPCEASSVLVGQSYGSDEISVSGASGWTGRYYVHKDGTVTRNEYRWKETNCITLVIMENTLPDPPLTLN